MFSSPVNGISAPQYQTGRQQLEREAVAVEEPSAALVSAHCSSLGLTMNPVTHHCVRCTGGHALSGWYTGP